MHDNFEKINNKKIISTFINEIQKDRKDCLKFTNSDLSLFKNNNVFSEFDHKNNLEELKNDSKNKKYDLIILDLPLGNSFNRPKKYKSYRIPDKWRIVFELGDFLKEDGIILFNIEPSFIVSSRSEKIRKILNSEDYYIDAVFKTPEKILSPITLIQPDIFIISRKQNTHYFIAELLNENQSKKVVNNYFANKFEGDLKKGWKIKKEDFEGFYKLEIKNQIEKLETQYKEYKQNKLKDIAIEINIVRPKKDTFSEKENSLYFSRLGNSKLKTKMPDEENQINYFQIVLDEEVNNRYLLSFFESDFGKLIIKSLLPYKSIVSRIRKKDLENAIIALPPKHIQEEIIETNDKIQKLKTLIKDFEEDLALKPKSSRSILNNLNLLLQHMDKLNDEDIIKNSIITGETKTVEFKETLRLNLYSNKKDEKIEMSVLKNIVAFLNTEGGYLLIGINDDGKIVGVEDEIKKLFKNKSDKYKLHLNNLIRDRIGKDFFQYIDYKLVKVEDLNVLMIKCKRSKKACYLNGNDFYVRTNPSANKLDGPELVDYVNNHFREK